MKETNTQFYTVSVKTFVIPLYYGSGSGSDFLARYGSGSGTVSQKVTVPVPVPQRCPQVQGQAAGALSSGPPLGHQVSIPSIHTPGRIIMVITLPMETTPTSVVDQGPEFWSWFRLSMELLFTYLPVPTWDWDTWCIVSRCCWHVHTSCVVGCHRIVCINAVHLSAGFQPVLCWQSY